ncbi:MAG: DUF2141 domain-containing protein [Gallionella sp.]
MRYSAVFIGLLMSFAAQAGDLKLEFKAKSMKGQTLMVALFDTKESFETDRFIQEIKIEASGDSTTLYIPNLPKGNYAIAAFLDSNKNGKIDKNFVGKPTELYGFSNDARSMFGSPSYAKSVFTVGDGLTTQTIHLQ